MIQKFQKHIESEFADVFNQKVLVAISGGVDSVVLAFLLKKIGVSIVLAHCNFQLRGQESQDDENFVIGFAQMLGTPIEVVRFDTLKYALEHQLNKQLAARQLRYKWFERMANQHQCQYIATAHHANDNLETFFINLFRGTGLKGLSGIPARNGRIIRPMLRFSREQIVQIAEQYQLNWREDSSNFSDDYTRNYIRHHIVTQLHNVHSHFLSNFHQTQQFVHQTQQFVASQIEQIRQKYQKQEQNIVYLQIDEIAQSPNKEFIIFELMNPFGFVNMLDLNRLLTAQSGKKLYSATHRVVKYGNQWIISPISIRKEVIYLVDEQTTQIKEPIHLVFSHQEYKGQNNRNTAFINQDKIQFPLKIRKWKHNDTFAPMGMLGKKKKLSKFFKDEKYSLLEKENQWLLTTFDDQIIWVIGRRLDQRFIADNDSVSTLKIFLIN